MTECNNSLHILTVPQENAIDLLVTGKTDGDVGEAVGVHRTTVARWRLCHPEFQAELNRRRAELWGAAAQRVRAMLPKALDAVEAALDDPDTRMSAAVQLLKMSGLPDKKPSAGPLDADEIIGPQVQKRISEKRAERNKHLSMMDRMNVDFGAPDVEQEEADAQAARQEVLSEIETRLAE